MELVERDDVLAQLDQELDGSAQRGRLVLVLGEAGNGKTTLVDTWIRTRAEGVRVLHGACDGSATPRPLGPLLDAMPGLAAGADRTDLVASALQHLAPPRPTPVLVVEDLHWADEATLDLVRAIAVRLTSTSALVLLTARSDEIEPGTPLATLVGDLVSRPDVARIELAPLTFAGVRTLVDRSGGGLDAGALFRRTGGNAFHTTEILATGEDTLPASVREAVLARVSRLSPDARASIDVVSLAGLRAELDLLAAVLGERAEAVDEAVRRGVLVDVGDGLRFRHELARMAVADDVPPMRHVAIHRGILRWLLENDSDDPARIAHHAEAAGDHATAYRASVAAGRQSAQLSAHREAVMQYARALRLAPRDAEGRVELLEALSYEQYLTSQIEDAITTRAQALAMHQASGERAGVVGGHRWLSRLHWFNANGAAAHEHGRRAVELVQPDDLDHETAMALSNMAQLCMLSTDVEGAQRWGGRALAMGRALDAPDVVSHALNNIGTAEADNGWWEQGAPKLEESLQVALVDGLQEHAARAYTNLVSSSSDQLRLADTERWLVPALAYCADNDLDSWLLYIDGYQAKAHLSRGRYAEALTVSDRVLEARAAAPVSRLTALVVRGLVQLRTGDAAADATLAEARHLAEDSDELQRIGPVALALAEAAWLRGDDVPDLLATATGLAERFGLPSRVGPVASWLHRLGALDDVPAGLDAPWADEVGDRWLDASRWWAERGFPYEQALALAETGDVEALSAAVRLLDDLGATTTSGVVGRRLAALGGRVPRPRRASTREHPAGLTAREADVLVLLVDGRTNSEIAEALTVSRRTAENHVAALLTKLGAANRREAVAVATERGWVPT